MPHVPEVDMKNSLPRDWILAYVYIKGKYIKSDFRGIRYFEYGIKV